MQVYRVGSPAQGPKPCWKGCLGPQVALHRRHVNFRSIDRTTAHLIWCNAVASKEKWLENGSLQVSYFNEEEFALLADENLGERCTYLQEGIQLADGDVVLDVGCNIGLFSMRASKDVGHTGHVIGVDAVPAACDLASKNLANHASWMWNTNGKPAAGYTIMTAAVGRECKESVTFHHYPRAVGWSCLDPDPQEVRQNMKAFLDQLLQQPTHTPQQTHLPSGPNSHDTTTQHSGSPSTHSSLSPSSSSSALHTSSTAKEMQKSMLEYSTLIQAGRLLGRVPLLGKAALNLVEAVAVEWMLADCEEVIIPQLTVSTILDMCNLDRVDLLKVDVERAEWAVLAGIQDKHWPMIKQLSLEVHGSHPSQKPLHLGTQSKQYGVNYFPKDDGKSGDDLPQADQGFKHNVQDEDLIALSGFLQQKGYVVSIRQEPEMLGTNLYMLYARQIPSPHLG